MTLQLYPDGDRPAVRDLSLNLDNLLSDGPQSTRTPRPVPLPDLPGFEVLSELGRAGMGVVYKARHLQLDQIVAVKMLRDGAMAGGEQMDRFCTEAQILANLKHPNIVGIIEIGEHDGRLYMALEFAEGGNLAQFLAGKRLTAVEAARLIEPLARAMHFVHQTGVLHRDLKPANILLRTDGTPMIADFGLGKCEEKDQTISGAILGTPSYMSPEQAYGRGREMTVATDVYSLGAIFYECLTGQPPFKGATIMDTLDAVRNERPRPPRQLAGAVSPELESICLKCLEKEPEQRYESTEELADELARVLTGQPLRKTPPSESEELRRRRTSAAVTQGLKFLEGGSLREALVWFAEALQREVPLDDTSSLGPAAWRDQVHRIRLACLLRQVPRLVQLWFPDTPAVRAEFSPGGQRLIAAAEDGTVRILDLDTAEVVAESSWHHANVNRLSFSADGRLLVSASDDGTARVWDPNLGEALSPKLCHSQWVTHAAFSFDGRYVATGCVDGTAHIWNWETASELFPAVEHGGMLWCVVFSPDGRHFATAGWNGHVRLWNAATGVSLGRSPIKHGDGVRQVTFSADSLRIATASDDNTARVWTVATGEALTLPLKHPSPVRRVAFSQDDQYLLTWTDDGKVRVWDATTGTPHTTELPALVLSGLKDRSPEGRRQLECGEDGVLRLWDWGHLGPCDSHWGRWLGKGSAIPTPDPVSKKSTTLERRRTKVAPNSTEGPPTMSARTLPRVCANADGRMVVLRMPDGTLRVHDADSGEPLTAAIPLESAPLHVTFGEGGKELSVVEENGRRRVYDLTPNTLPAADLVCLVRLLTGRRLDEGGSLKLVAMSELAQYWNDLGEKYPSLFHVMPEEIEHWHEEAALSCESAGLWAEAVGHLEAIQQHQPNNADLWVRRAKIWARCRNWKAAGEAYTRALDLDDDWTYWYGRGLINLELGEWNRAGRDFTRAGARNDCWQTWYYRAVAQIHLERFRHALADLTEALTRNPRERVCLSMRGCLYAFYGRWEPAAADFALARELGECRPWVLYQHALVCLRRDDREGHTSIVRTLMEQTEKSRSVEIGTWATWTALLGSELPEDMQRLLVWVERARTTHREIGSSLQQFGHTLCGLALCRVGRWAEAVTHLESPPVGEGSAWDWLLLAWAHFMEGRPVVGRQWLKKAYQWLGWISPKSVETPPPPRLLPWHQKLELRALRGLVEPLFMDEPRTGSSTALTD